LIRRDTNNAVLSRQAVRGCPHLSEMDFLRPALGQICFSRKEPRTGMAVAQSLLSGGRIARPRG